MANRNWIILLFTVQCYTCFAQHNRLQISSDFCMGASLEFSRAQNLNDKSYRHLMARQINDKMLRFQAKWFFNKAANLGISSGVNYGESRYLQPIFLSHQALSIYNETQESVEFGKSHISGLLGLSYYISLYDDAFRLQFSSHLAYNKFLNTHQVVQRDFQIATASYNFNVYDRYQIEIKDKKHNLCFDFEVKMLFRLTKDLFLNFGLNYFAARKFEYDYKYQFKFYNKNTELWTPTYQHNNFLILTQPRRIDHVFYFHTGISYTPKFGQRKKKDEGM